MVNLLIALFIELGFLLCLAAMFYLGYRMGKRTKSTPSTDKNEETIRKAKELEEDFQAIMNYDINTAMQRKKVI